MGLLQAYTAISRTPSQRTTANHTLNDSRPRPVLEQAPPPESPERRWSDLVSRIRTGQPEAMAELYRIFGRGVRFYLCRQLGPQELDDKVHDTFLVVVQAIQRGELREPERLMGFVRTVVRRQVAAHIEQAVQRRRHVEPVEEDLPVTDHRMNPEQSLLDRERIEIMLRLLGAVSERDREILTRFYLKQQSPETICREMELTENQFRLLKSRAKARFGEMGRRRLAKPPLRATVLNAACAAGRRLGR